MKIRKFNEKLESGHATWEYLVGAAEVKNIDDRDLFSSLRNGPEEEFIFHPTEIKNFNGGYYIELFNKDLILVFEGSSETPKAILSIYELHGTNVFENMIVIYGHENIILYNTQTGNYKDIATR